MLIPILFLFLQVCYAFIEGSSNNECEIELVASWDATPFALQVVESISSFNESLYEVLVNSLFDLKGDEEAISVLPGTDKGIYDQLIALVENAEQRKLIDIHLANKFRTPRVEAHFQHYREILQNYKTRLVSQCGGLDSAWALYNDQIFCSSDDLFAIITDNNEQKGFELAFDRVIGDPDSPTIIVYGAVENENLQSLIKTLHEFTVSGQYSFVWRYIPPRAPVRKERLAGYGVDLTLKRTDYIVIDDRNAKKREEANTKQGSSLDMEDPLEIHYDDIQKVFDIESLELQFTQFIADRNDDGYRSLKKLIGDFPKYASYLSGYSDSNFSSILHSAKTNSRAQPGLYINGRTVGQNGLNVDHIVKLLSQAFNLIDILESYGLDAVDAKAFIQDFSSSRQHSSTSGAEVQRYNILGWEDSIVYVNDLERDNKYRHFKSSRKAYLNPGIKPGQIPAIRENIHDTIFVINLSDPTQLYLLLAYANSILQRDIPQQIGIVPLIHNELDLKLSKRFLHLVHSESIRSGMAFLQELSSAIISYPKGSMEYDISVVYQEDLAPEHEPEVQNLLILNENFIRNFNVERPHIIANGVFYDFVEQWQYVIAVQLYQDVLQIREALKTDQVDGSIREYLLRDSPKKRNTWIISDSPDFSGILFYATADLSQISIVPEGAEFPSHACEDIPLTLSLVGPFGSPMYLRSLLEVLVVKEEEPCLKIRVFNSGSDSEVFTNVEPLITADDIEGAIELLQKYLTDVSELRDTAISSSKLNAIRKAFGLEKFQGDELFIVLNGRVLPFHGDYFSSEEIGLLIEYEKSSRLKFISQKFASFLSSNLEQDQHDVFEKLSSTLSHHLSSPEANDGSIFLGSDVSRYSIANLDFANSVNYRQYNAESKIDVVAVVKPIDEFSQQVISILELFEGFQSTQLNIQVLLLPSPALKEMKINRFYRGVFPNSINFAEDGSLVDEASAFFASVPQKALFTFDLDVPSSWVVGINEGDTDLDNVKLVDTGDVLGIYELEHILVEGYARGTPETGSVGGIQVQLNRGESYTDTNIMINLGYLQLKANPGIWNFEIKPGSTSDDLFALSSANVNYFDETPLPAGQRYQEISILDLSGTTIYPIMKPAEARKSLVGSFKSMLGNLFSTAIETQAEINIFSVASGHLYERFLGIMTASVMKHTKHSVKFWIIENYMSPTFKKNLPKLAEEYGFNYELVTYKWPNWLRSQREKQRTIWGYKILFLDVLFPQSLDKVIFVDADQIVRTDMKELVDIDLEGAPYGYTPMCDSREEMEGFRFWKQGYWDKVLGQNGLKYHISALYVIDLKKFREIRAGDRLRQHYQTLSADPGSLSNLDQDLPNNLQSKIKIFSLPQEWLWCETWCSDESLKVAKTIDLCNNPLTKEPKLDRARRQVSEWTSYDNEINDILTGTKELAEASDHDEL